MQDEVGQEGRDEQVTDTGVERDDDFASGREEVAPEPHAIEDVAPEDSAARPLRDPGQPTGRNACNASSPIFHVGPSWVGNFRELELASARIEAAESRRIPPQDGVLHDEISITES